MNLNRINNENQLIPDNSLINFVSNRRCYSNKENNINLFGKYNNNFINNSCNFNNNINENTNNNNYNINNNNYSLLNNINNINIYGPRNNTNKFCSTRINRGFSYNLPCYNYSYLNCINNINPNKIISQTNKMNNEISHNYINYYANNTFQKNNNNINSGNNNFNIINTAKNIIDNNIEQKNINNNTINENISKEKIIKNTNDFLNYVKNLKMPLIQFVCTTEGSKKMENILNNSPYDCKKILIKLLGKKDLPKVMKNTIGNYFIQKLVKNLNENEILLILQLIKQDFVEISKNYSGTHAIQALLEKITSPKIENIILESIENCEISMAYDLNSTHVLQKILTSIKDINRKKLNEIILKNTKDLALNSNSIFLLKKFISTITIEDNKKRLINILSKYCISLAQNPYGNYAIQYLLENFSSNDIEKINEKIIEFAFILTKQKFSSNVIEKSMEFFDKENRDKLINNLCFCDDTISLIKNKYGHFVFNHAINYMSEDTKIKFKKKLENDILNLSSKEKAKIRKFINNLESSITPK